MTIFYLPIATNLLKCHGVVGRIVTKLTNRCDILGFHIHQCTSVTKNRRICDEFNKSSQSFGLQYPSMHVCAEKKEYFIDVVILLLYICDLASVYMWSCLCIYVIRMCLWCLLIVAVTKSWLVPGCSPWCGGCQMLACSRMQRETCMLV
jgi:hypothetical protein